jgi:hypothetical protein
MRSGAWGTSRASIPRASAAHPLDTLDRPGFHYQTCGVMLLDLSPVTHAQADLFDTRDCPREAWLVRALDDLNAEYGARTVRVGNIGGTDPPGPCVKRFAVPAIRRTGKRSHGCSSR